MSEISRLRWLCRRGMKELDLLMERYLDQHFERASQQDQQAFRVILQMPDPELYDLVLGRNTSKDPDIARVIQVMLEQSSQP